ncbi:hypothetical protein BAZSYMB_GORF0_GLIMMER3 [Bathymodiolus azoricus thioautotrophic gill symbiont]|uniref:Uncharacterized protein n=1 Tax=Bathymodiolus azoricus thioautotrophic gill symbiont TaxID=235205 RepID=A0A1H6JQR6_9GAMM|nr:hypothetical protein BAZSYMB_GORF0_GLIMMER3 [Bathymodiolus azoricus thioautotrophic gill symbiont]
MTSLNQKKAKWMARMFWCTAFQNAMNLIIYKVMQLKTTKALVGSPQLLISSLKQVHLPQRAV